MFDNSYGLVGFVGPNIKMEEPNPKIVKVDERNVTLSCQGESYPTPYVTWKKDGNEITQLNSTEVANYSVVYQRVTQSGWDNKSGVYLVVTSELFLRPRGIRYEDHGNYTCEVLNAKESSEPISKTVEIQFPPRITRRPQNMKMNEKENVFVTCDAEGPPKPTLNWAIVKGNVTIGKIVRNKTKLELINVRSTGLYNFTVICIATNKGGNSTANATIEILVRPRIIELTSNQTALLYHNITLKCEILANPSAEIWWTKDGNKSHLDNVRFENDFKTLVITEAILNNVGEYACHAKSNLSSTNRELTLNLKAIPKTYIVGEEIRKMRLGQKNISIICLGYGYPDPTATWKINNKEIPEYSNSSVGSGTYQQRSTNDVTSTLYFNQSGSTFEDFGTYTCEVSIKQAPDTDAKNVTVIFYPIVTAGPSNVTELQNNDVRFDCEVDGRPLPSTKWLFKNQNISTNHSLLGNGSFLLHSVRNTEAYEGVYSCFAENEAGRSEKSDATLTVHVPTRILNISKTEVHQPKDNLTLTCNVEGDPRPSVTWTKTNSSALTPPKFILSNYNQSLTIMNVTQDEQGTYVCEAKNKYRKETKNVTVNVKVRPQAEVNSSSVIYLDSIYERVIIRCRGRGYPSPVVSWFRDGTRISTNSSSSDVYQIIGKRNPTQFLEWISTILYVNPDASHGQFGNYTCNSTKLKDNEQDLEKVEIVLVPTITITRTPNTSTVLEGTDVSFTCTADGAPKPTISWNRVNGTISSTKFSRNSSVGQSVLVLTNVTNEEEGVYECTARNRGAPAKKQVNLTVHVKPRILQQMEDDDVQNGTSYKLNCSADGDPALTYSWTRNNNQNIANSILINENKTLQINPVTINNEGIYKCVVTNIEGNTSTTANITVFSRPKILDSPVNITRSETENATFSCGGKGIPTPDIFWRKNKEEIKNSTMYDIVIVSEQFNVRKSYLTIKNLKYADRGNYSCSLKNRKSEDVDAAVLVVQVRPVAKIYPKSRSVNITKVAVFTCNAYGFPKPHVSWMKNGRKIENNAHYDITFYGNGSNLIWHSNLSIKKVRRDDTGDYSCFLKNAAGTDVMNASLIVLERPDPPLNISLKNISSRSVIVGWKKNFNGNKDIIHFTLKYFINGSKLETPKAKQMPSNLTSFNVTSLKPNSTYVFQITATNEIGISNASSVSGNTLEDRPTNPRSVDVVPVSSTSLNVSWLPPEEENGVIQHYVIYYGRVGSGKNRSKNAKAIERSSIITNLKPYANYSVAMVAKTSIGYGKRSERVFKRTHEAAPSSPLNLTVQVKSNTTISVSWLPPEDENGIIVRYHIHVKEQGVVNSSEWIVNATEPMTSEDVDSLKPYTIYTFRVQAKTNAGWGNFSQTETEQTKEGLPSKPLHFIANVSSNTSVFLSWKEPEDRNGIITKYHVYYNKTSKTGSLTKPSTNRTQMLVKRLTPYTIYAFWVYAATSAGLGNQSVIIIKMTFEGVPTEPRNVKGIALNSTSINTTWLGPENPFGKIVKYVVYYQQEPAGTEGNGWNMSVGNRNAVLTSLNVNTNYSIAVQAFTAIGGGKRSESKKVPTLPGTPVAPTESPKQVTPTGKAKKDFNDATMLYVELPKFSDKNGKIIKYKVIVVMIEDTVFQQLIFNKDLLSYKQWSILEEGEKIGKPYVAFVFDGGSFAKHKHFTVGNGEESTGRKKRAAEEVYKNGELLPNRIYAVALRGYTAKDKYSTSKPLIARTRPLPAEREPGGVDTTSVVVIIVVAVVLSALFLTAVWFRIKKNRGERPHGDDIGIRNLGHPVPVAEFRFYVQSKQFGEEFQTIPKAVDRDTTAATIPSNMQKNRYKNIIPYDYTRVRLQRDEGDDDTDYVNASIIKGLKVPSKYIATQGPLPHTTNDFWRMVWEQEASSVVMLTGLEEKGTVKCYQYWPVGTGEKEYGNLTLKLTGEIVLADFTTRYFEMKETITGQVRLVQHLHFTAWPDHGVPKYPGPLLHFHKRYRSGLSGGEPVIVHCSAGVGRTGTFIALDYILHKLDEERDADPSIDILHFVREMRGQRHYMVQTAEQYTFIHHAILEAVTLPDTEISSADIRVRAAILREKIPGTNKTKGKEVFENLQKRILIESCEDGSSSDNQKKNRSHLLPFDFNRVPLNEMQNCTDYINASFICGYQFPRNFIATQYPLPNTVSDFWRMVHEQKSAIIVDLSTKEELDEFGSYWPEEGYTSYGPINVAFEETRNNFAASGFMARKFKLTDTRDNVGRSFAVTHFHFVDWSRNDLPTAASMLQLLAEVEKVQRLSANALITVHCSDGGGRTGAFCAMVSCIERVKVENNVDLPMILRNLQAQRMDMIENEAQYVFCYDVVAAFLASFDDQMYDNFKKSTSEDDEENFPETTMDDQNRLVSKF